MNTTQTAPADIDQYIAGFPQDVQERLEAIRATIRKAAPEARETISYQIPTFTLGGKYLVHSAAFKHHIGLYPVPLGNPELQEELSPYAAGKGTAKFPLSQPVPLDLITRIVKFLVSGSHPEAP